MVGKPLPTSLASHTDLKVIQQMLGHSSIVTTADTYTSVLPETAHRAAQATADMVINAARSAPGSRLGGTVVPHGPGRSDRLRVLSDVSSSSSKGHHASVPE